MSDGRQRLSGHQYSKLRKEKEEKLKKDVDSSRKILDFFKSSTKELEFSDEFTAPVQEKTDSE